MLRLLAAIVGLLALAAIVVGLSVGRSAFFLILGTSFAAALAAAVMAAFAWREREEGGHRGARKAANRQNPGSRTTT